MQDRTPRMCWKSFAVWLSVISLLIFVCFWMRSHVFIDNHPSTLPFLPARHR